MRAREWKGKAGEEDEIQRDRLTKIEKERGDWAGAEDIGRMDRWKREMEKGRDITVAKG